MTHLDRVAPKGVLDQLAATDLIASMTPLALHSGPRVRRLLNSFGEGFANGGAVQTNQITSALSRPDQPPSHGPLHEYHTYSNAYRRASTRAVHPQLLPHA